jgi:hypothetical protein
MISVFNPFSYFILSKLQKSTHMHTVYIRHLDKDNGPVCIHVVNSQQLNNPASEICMFN